MPVIGQILSQLIPFWMTRGQRLEEAEIMKEKAEMMKLQQKQISLNMKEKEQILETINSLNLPPEQKTGLLLNPKMAGMLMFLTNRGQEAGPQIVPPEGSRAGRLEEGMVSEQRPGLPGQIAQGQLGITPDILTRAIPKMLFGLDMGRPQIRTIEVTPEDIQSGGLPPNINRPGEWEVPFDPATNQWRYDLGQFGGYEELVPIQRETLGGGKETIHIPRSRFQAPSLGLQAGGMPGPGIRTKLPIMEQPIKETGLPLWVHPETLESPPTGMSPDEAAKQGYRRVSTEAKNRIDAAKGMKEVLVKLGELMRDVFPPKGGLEERMRGAPSRLFGARTQYDPSAAQLESFINGTVAPIIRSFGEKGNLSETDVKRAINLMPKITDSADVAWGKFNNLIELINNIQRSAIGGKPGLGLKPGKPKKKKADDPLGLR